MTDHMSTAAADTTQVPYWDRYIGLDGKWKRTPPKFEPVAPPGEELAALRTGLGRPPGSAFAVWPFCSAPTDDRLARRDRITDLQKAEHAALALFGLHQQSQKSPMHKQGISLARALRTLRERGRYSEQALNRRVDAAANSTNTTALLVHLRGLITQLRGEAIPLDYDRLVKDLRDFETPTGRHAVRRRWGADYYGLRK